MCFCRNQATELDLQTPKTAFVEQSFIFGVMTIFKSSDKKYFKGITGALTEIKPENAGFPDLFTSLLPGFAGILYSLLVGCGLQTEKSGEF